MSHHKFKSPPWLRLLAMAAGLTSIAYGQSSAISGSAFNDLNGDAAQQRSEPPAAGLMVVANSMESSLSKETTTNADGRFVFTEMPPGRYKVNIIGPGVVTVPALGSHTITLPSQLEPIKFAVHQPCATIPYLGSSFEPTSNPLCHIWNLQLKNTSGFPITELYFNPPAGITVTPTSNLSSVNHVSFSPPWAPGATVSLKLQLCGLTFGKCINIPLLVFNAATQQCCETTLRKVCPPNQCLAAENKIICSHPGFSWQLCLTNISGQTANKVLFGAVRDLNGNIVGTVSPGTVNTTFPNLATQCFNLTLNGPPDGTVVTVDVLLYASNRLCCFRTLTLLLPDCGRCTLCRVPKAALKPPLTGDKAQWSLFPGAVLGITCGYDPNLNLPVGQRYVAAYLNMNNYWSLPAPFLPLGDNHTPAMYHGPLDSNGNGIWREEYLGTPFGMTIDNQGSTYVAHFGLYKMGWSGSGPYTGPQSGHAYPTGPNYPFGSIVKLDKNTGQPSLFAVMPNHQVLRPGLGNITFDPDHNQIFATNLEDGLIYRIPMTGNTTMTWPAGTWYGPFAPNATPTDIPNGMAPLGARIFGIKYHCGRLYFARWSTNNFDPPGDNRVYSTAIGPTGQFLPATLRVEPGQSLGFSTNPISDISFSPEGYMGCAELTVQSNQIYRGATTVPMMYSHSSKAFEMRCVAGVWAPRMDTNGDPMWKIGAWEPGWGSFFPKTNSNGGMDYDYFGGTNANSGRRVWITAAYNNYFNVNGPYNCTNSAYGLVGMPPLGGDSGLKGTLANTMIVDYDNSPDPTCNQKWFFGDVECPRVP